MPTRLFVIWSTPVFRESVRLLLRHPDVEWVGLTSDYDHATEEILRAQPETILVEEIDGRIPADLMAMLGANPFSLRLIGASLADNKLNVYHHEQRAVAEAGDLLRLILQ